MYIIYCYSYITDKQFKQLQNDLISLNITLQHFNTMLLPETKTNNFFNLFNEKIGNYLILSSIEEITKTEVLFEKLRQIDNKLSTLYDNIYFCIGVVIDNVYYTKAYIDKIIKLIYEKGNAYLGLLNVASLKFYFLYVLYIKSQQTNRTIKQVSVFKQILLKKLYTKLI